MRSEWEDENWKEVKRMRGKVNLLIFYLFIFIHLCIIIFSPFDLFRLFTGMGDFFNYL